MNPDERWTKAWTYLLLGCWLFSAFCWGGPSFPGIWNNDCVVAEKQEGAVGSELCAQVELSRNGNDVEDNHTLQYLQVSDNGKRYSHNKTLAKTPLLSIL